MARCIQTSATQQIWPIRMGARKQGEMLCVLAFQDTEWLALHEASTATLGAPKECRVMSGASVSSLIEDE